MSRTYRKKYSGAKAVSKECRNHGECEYCMHNRLHKALKEEQRTRDMYLYYTQELSTKGGLLKQL